MRILVEIEEEAEVQPIDGDTAYVKRKAWLLYFGTDYQIIELGDEKIAAVNYTIAVCEDYKTGQVECVRPQQIKILGRELNTEKP